MPYIGQLPATGENNAFRILDDISSYVLTFDGSDASVVSTSNDTITITGAENRFLTGQRVTYSKGSGGTVITGLTDDTAYYAIRDSNTTIKLATSSSNATNGVAVDLTGVGGGTAHKITLAFDGTNTKFRTTYDSGKQDPKVTRAAQLVLSINGIIQQPIDSTSPSSGFGIDGGDIVFSTAPDANDDFWGHVLASNTVTFDISDNDIDNFTGDGSTVNFTLSKTPSDNRNVLVTLDGVVQYPSDNSTTRAYQVSENELQFVSAPALNVSIQVRHIGFAGASSGSSASGGVTGFYGRTGNVVLKNTDNPVIGNLTAVDGTFSGNVSIAKTLTYMDVAHIDAVGVVTAQSGIQCLDDLNVGLGTFFVDKSTGFVGIGTIVPVRKLHVVSDEQVVGLLTSTNAANKSFLRMSDPTTTSQGTAPSIGSKGDFLELRTGSATRLTIDSSGNIGIGSTAPAQLLHLEKNGAFQILLKRGGGSPSEVAFKNSGNYAVISNNTNGIDLQTGTTPSSSLHIDQNGKVGITTEEPQRNLHIHQNTAASAYLHMTNSTTGATTTDGFSLYIATSGIAYYRARETTGQHVFYTGTTEKFRIDEDGKVGIGSDDPDAWLHIQTVSTTGDEDLIKLSRNQYEVGKIRRSAGAMRVSGDGNLHLEADYNTDHGATDSNIIFNVDDDEKVRITSAGRLGIGTDNPSHDLDIESVHPTIELKDSDNNYIFQLTQSGSATYVDFDTTGEGSSSLRIRNAGSEKVRITSGGLVGIGTDNPDSKLSIYSGTAGTVTADADADELTLESSGNVGLSLLTAATGESSIYFGNPGTNGQKDGWIKYYHESHSTTADRRCLSFKTGGGSEKMRLDATGRLLINRTAQHASSSERLSVNGMTSIQKDSTSTAGLYVFNEETTSDGTVQPFIFCHDGSGIRSGLGVQRSTGKTILNGQFGISLRTGSSGVGGDERLFIKSDGNVGIGTDNASTQLHLKGSDPTFRIQRYDQSAYGDITVDTAGKIIFKSDPGAAASSDGFQFTVNNDEKLMINSSGQVGINQDDWADKDHMLEVVNDTHNVEIARFTSSSGGSGSVVGEGSIGLSVFSSTTYPHVSIGVEENSNASYAGHLTFATRSAGNDSKPVEKMRIKSSGEVGIGTTTPSGTLHLSGTGPVLTCTADNGSSGLRVNTVNQTTGQVFRIQQDSTTKFEVAWNGHTTITNGFSFGPHSGHTNDENVKMHLYSDDNINDAVDFSVAIQFGNANNGPFMIELYQAHGHYTGNASYCKILGSYGAHDASGGCSFLVLEKQGYIDTGGVFEVTDNSTSTQRTNNTNYTVTITGKAASSDTGTSLKVKTYVIVYSRTGPASVVFAEV